MDRDRFWTVIAEAGDAGPTTEERIAALTTALGEMSPSELVDFDTHLATLVGAAMRWDVWGAAYLMCGGCSDDAFWDFRAWLVLQGRPTYDAVLADPDHLATVEVAAGDYPSAEELIYAAGSAHETLTGSALERPPIDEADLGDDEWDFDDEAEAQRRYPALFARYWDDPL